MKALMLTNEYPPTIYGGAGVHVDNLSRELARFCDIDLRCFGDQRAAQKSLHVRGFETLLNYEGSPAPLRKAFDAVERCLDFNAAGTDAEIVHVHTWYTHFGGILAKLCYGIPLVLTVHSLEPLRPWKREQLAGGYDFSCWVEKTAMEMADAVIAVSQETKADVLRLFNLDPDKVAVIHNGIDPEECQPVNDPERIARYGIDPQKPYVLFLGRITRQKGILHLINAVPYLDRNCQVVLCASSPDTPEIAAEMQTQVTRLQQERGGVIWIDEQVDADTKRALYSHASVFCCPSVYEPFGIINLEAMACETPVVASAIGGIKEVVVDRETGFLVKVDPSKRQAFELADPAQFAHDLAAKINLLVDDEKLRKKMGKAGKKRAVGEFSWSVIARRTAMLYKSILETRND